MGGVIKWPKLLRFKNPLTDFFKSYQGKDNACLNYYYTRRFYQIIARFYYTEFRENTQFVDFMSV